MGMMQALRNFGLECDNIIKDGNIHRCHSTAKSKRNKDGWYRVDDYKGQTYLNFGCWVRGEKGWWSDDDQHGSSTVDNEIIKMLAKRCEQEEKQKRKKAKARAADIISKAKPASCDHPYLVRKGVDPCGVLEIDGELIIPVYSSGFNIESYQTIDADGNKKFMPGGGIGGNCFVINGNSSTVCICEGFATGATIFKATGFMVFVAFNSGNMPKVAEQVAEKNKNSNIIICADNDYKNNINVGLKKGKEAAKNIGASCVWPEGIDGTDFNDMAAEMGISEVTTSIIKGHTVEVYQKIKSKNNLKLIKRLIDEAPEVLKKIISYYDSTAIKPQPLFGLATGLILGSLITSRKYKTQFNNYSTNYFLLVAKSGTGKDHPKFVIRKILEECNLSWLERAGGYTASNTVMRSLEKQPIQITFFEEIGQKLNEAALNKRSMSSGVFRQLLDIWSSCHSISVGDEYVDGSTPQVSRPALGVVGLTTPRELFRAINESLIEQGFVNRLLPFISDQDRVATPLSENKCCDEDFEIISRWIKDHWPQVDSEIGMIVDVSDEERANPHGGEVIEIPFDSEAIEVLNELESDVVALSEALDKIGLDDIPSRNREIIMRISMIIALMDGGDMITQKHVKWSRDLVFELYRRYIDDIKRHVAGSDFENAKLECLNHLRSLGKKGVRPIDMPKQSPWSKFEKRLREDILSDLVDSGLAEKTRLSTGKRGPKTEVWVALK